MAIEKSRGDISHFISAVLGWLVSAVTLLIVFSFFVCKTSMDSSYIGYISSFISFSSATFAGAYSYKNKKGETLISSLVTALFVVILLLTVGFLIRGNDMTSAGIISVASFTFTGILLGGNIKHLFGKRGKKQTNRHYRKQMSR